MYLIIGIGRHYKLDKFFVNITVVNIVMQIANEAKQEQFFSNKTLLYYTEKPTC